LGYWIWRIATESLYGRSNNNPSKRIFSQREEPCDRLISIYCGDFFVSSFCMKIVILRESVQQNHQPQNKKMKYTTIGAIIMASLLAGCAGIRETNNQFTAHAECFRFIGNAIPADDQAAARALVPQGSKVNITNLQSTPADWTSILGGIGNIIGFHSTTISGTK